LVGSSAPNCNPGASHLVGYGGAAIAGSLGMALGPVAGGLIYDAFASHTWFYVGASAMGVGAFLIATTFRPFPKSGERRLWRPRDAARRRKQGQSGAVMPHPEEQCEVSRVEG
jgi:MFS family permease